MATNKDKGSSVKKTGGHKGDGKKFENRGRNDISSKFQRPVRSEMEVKVHAIMSEIAALNDQIKGHRDEISKVNDATKGARVSFIYFFMFLYVSVIILVYFCISGRNGCC